jgi:hypothetical protein
MVSITQSMTLPQGTSANRSQARTFGTQGVTAATETKQTKQKACSPMSKDHIRNEVLTGNSDKMARDGMNPKAGEGQARKCEEKPLKAFKAGKCHPRPKAEQHSNSSKGSKLHGSVSSSAAAIAFELRADEKLNAPITACKAHPFYHLTAFASAMTPGTATQCPPLTTLASTQAAETKGSDAESSKGFPKGFLGNSSTGNSGHQSVSSASTLPGIPTCKPELPSAASNGSIRLSPNEDATEEITTRDEGNAHDQSNGTDDFILHEEEVRHGFALFRELLTFYMYWEAALTGYDKNRLLALLMPCDGSAMTTAIIAGVASQVAALVDFALNSGGIGHGEGFVDGVIHEEEIQQGFALLRELLIFQIYNEEALTGNDKNRLLALLMPCEATAVTIATVIRVASQVQAARAALARHFDLDPEHSG